MPRLFQYRSPPRPLDRSSLRQFETSPYRAVPRGPPSSLAQHDAIRVFLTQQLPDYQSGRVLREPQIVGRKEWLISSGTDGPTGPNQNGSRGQSPRTLYRQRVDGLCAKAAGWPFRSGSLTTLSPPKLASSERIQHHPTDLLPIGPARLKPLPRNHFQNVLPMRQRPQLPDVPQIDNVRTMNPQKALRIERSL